MTDMFIPGQRWVSHADSTLGLGIVTTADTRRVTLHFPAVEEERVYATDRAPLTRLLLKTGDQLIRMDGASLDRGDRRTARRNHGLRRGG